MHEAISDRGVTHPSVPRPAAKSAETVALGRRNTLVEAPSLKRQEGKRRQDQLRNVRKYWHSFGVVAPDGHRRLQPRFRNGASLALEFHKRVTELVVEDSRAQP